MQNPPGLPCAEQCHCWAPAPPASPAGVQMAEPGHQFCLPLPRPFGKGVKKHSVTSQTWPSNFSKPATLVLAFQSSHAGTSLKQWESAPLLSVAHRKETWGINYSLVSGNEESLHLNTQHFLGQYWTQGLLSTVSQTGVCVCVCMYLYLCTYFLFLFVSKYIYVFL